MPIRRELRRLYGRHWREVTRPRILARAGGRFDSDGRYLGGAKCEQCGKIDQTTVWTMRTAGDQYWTAKLRPVAAQRWTYCSLGGGGNFVLFPDQFHRARLVYVILQVAHIDNRPGHDTDANLRALCGWCHLHHDRFFHRTNRATRKDRARPLL